MTNTSVSDLALARNHSKTIECIEIVPFDQIPEKSRTGYCLHGDAMVQLDSTGKSSYQQVMVKYQIILQPIKTLSLTGREKDCLELAQLRKKTKEIARILHISPETVRTHLKHIREKAQCDSIQQVLSALACDMLRVN